ncbi:MAG: hypothetical protein KGZ74_20520 [Chitinophagaceae bacterium]|nr:hypothetical protein [Chitinophagaceae bacterium]
MNNNDQRDFLTPNTGYLPPLPNSTVSLVMGILSIVVCGIGLVLGIIGLVMANKDLELYNNYPGKYSIASYNHTKTGRTCSIIGISLNVLFVIVYAAILIFAFTAQDNFR